MRPEAATDAGSRKPAYRLRRAIAYLRHDTTTGIQLGELDAFRGWACFTVFMYHCVTLTGWGRPAGGLESAIHWVLWPFRFGTLGLDIFFFLSGFLLYLRFGKAHMEGGPRPSVTGFYRRRIKRIVPAYYASMFIIVAAGLLFFRSGIRFGGVWDLVAHMLFLQNVLSEYVTSINTLYWTLALEFNFYLVLPFIAPWFHGRRWPYGLIGIIVAVACFKAGVLHYLAADPSIRLDPVFPPLSTLAWRLDQFAVGIAFGSIWLSSEKGVISNPFRDSRTFSALAILAGMALFYVLVYLDYRAGGLWTMDGAWHSIYRSPLLAVCIGLVVMGTLNLRVAKATLANPAIEFIGVISYSMYIWHAVVIVQLVRLFPAFRHDPSDGHAFLMKLGFVGLSLILTVAGSTVSYMLFERPFLRKGRVGRPENVAP